MKKFFLKWTVALLFVAFDGANLFAFEAYDDVEAGNGLYCIEVYTSSELARYASRGNIWPEDSYFEDFNTVITGLTENSFPKGKVCVIVNSEFEDNVTSITIPEKIDGYPVVGINYMVSWDAKTLTLPKSLVFLGAIDGENLESIKIQSQKLYFPYQREEYERGYELELNSSLPSLSEKSKSDLRKAGYTGSFPSDD